MTASTWCFLTDEGPAAIAVAQLSGPAVADFLAKHAVFHTPITLDALRRGALRRANLVDPVGDPIDDVLVQIESTAPDWLLQVHLHGSPGIAQRLRALLREVGFTETAVPLHDPWRSTTRVEAEVLALLPQISTWGGVRWLLRMRSELPAEMCRALSAETIETARSILAPLLERGWIVETLLRPARVAICGPPNAGKSTLMNTLTDRPVSLVSDRPGTTRDWIEATGQAGDFPVTWIDTAGMRNTTHELEAAGIERARQIIRESRFSIAVLDVTQAGSVATRDFICQFGDQTPTLVVWNKCDLKQPDVEANAHLPPAWRARTVSATALSGAGITQITESIARLLSPEPLHALGPACINHRQTALIKSALAEMEFYRLKEAVIAFMGAVPNE